MLSFSQLALILQHWVYIYGLPKKCHDRSHSFSKKPPVVVNDSMFRDSLFVRKIWKQTISCGMWLKHYNHIAYYKPNNLLPISVYRLIERCIIHKPVNFLLRQAKMKAHTTVLVLCPYNSTQILRDFIK